MANSINATSTGNGGIITTGDDSGVLNIQTNETTAISIDASQNATFTNGVNLPNTFGFKNRIINGAMVVNQRNATVTPAVGGDAYSVDRFTSYIGAGSGVFTAAQNTSAPAGFSNSLKITVTTADSSLAASDNYQPVLQIIEGLNTTDLAWGSASASAISISFWVRCSVTGTYPVAIRNSGSSRSYVTTFAVNAADTWEYKTMTIPGDTSGTWLTTNGIGIQVNFASVAGSDKQISSLNTWTAGSYTTHSSCTNFIATNGATFYITGVQLEKGTQATSFDFRSYGTELALCQRYFQKSYVQSVAPYTGTAIGCVGGVASDANYMPSSCSFPVVMRSNATVTVISASGTAGAISAAGNINKGSSYVVDQQSDSRILAVSGSGGALTAGTFYYFHFIASAEL